MKIPRFVVVRGERWRVVRVPLPGDLVGQCDYTSREIRLDPVHPDLEDTFLHELMHACLNNPPPHPMEERFIRKLTPPLLETLKGLGWVR